MATSQGNKCYVRDRITNEIIYPITSAQSIIINPIQMTAGDIPGGTLEAVIGQYYRFNEALSTLNVVLPKMPEDRLGKIVVNFLAGNSPAFSISSAEGEPVRFFKGFLIKPATEYVIQIQSNGKEWIVSYEELEFKGFMIKGKFTDDSTEEDWWMYFNHDLGKGVRVTGVDPITHDFEYRNVSFPERISALFYSIQSLQRIDKIQYKKIIQGQAMFNYDLKLEYVNLSDLDFSSCTNLDNLFFYCGALETFVIGEQDLSNVTSFSSAFTNCSKLTNVIGKLSNIKVSIDIKYSPLSNESAMVFINGLAPVEETKTITFKSSTYNTLTPEQFGIATSKNWIVASSSGSSVGPN